MEIYQHKVQYYETDQMGIVHHSNYIRWFEEARTDILEKAGFGYDKMEEYGLIIPVLAIEAEYKSMCRYGEIVCIEPIVSRYKGVRLEITYQITDQQSGEIRCLGKSKHCFLNKAGKPVSLQKEFPQIHQLMQRLSSQSEI